MWLYRIRPASSWIFAALFLIVIFSPILAQDLHTPDDLIFESITQEQGLSNNMILAIAQDKKGFMWFGTGDGLNRYDGYTFKTYRYIPGVKGGICHSTIWTLLNDKNGDLWVGTYGGGLDKYIPFSDTFEHFESIENDTHSLSHNEIRCIFMDSNSTLWVGTKIGLNRLVDEHSKKFKRYYLDPDNPGSISDDELLVIYEDSKKRLWFGTRHGLNRYIKETDSFQNYHHKSSNHLSLSNDTIRSICEDDNDQLWVGTDNGLNRFNPENGNCTRYFANPKNHKSLLNNKVRVIRKDQSGLFWLGTFSGVCLFNPENKIFFRLKVQAGAPNSLASNYIPAIYQDHFNIMWMGTSSSGAVKCNPQRKPFVRYRQNPNVPGSLSHNSVYSVYKDKLGTLWVGTFSGLNRKDKNTSYFTHYSPIQDNDTSLSDDHVSAIAEDYDNVIWIGTFAGGLNRFNRDKEIFTHYTYDEDNSNSLSDNSINFIYEDYKNYLWIATSKGLNRMNPQRSGIKRFISNEKDSASLSHNLTNYLMEDSNKVLWVGTVGGLNRFNRDTQTFTRYSSQPENPNSLSNNHVTVMYEDRSGTFWVGTYGGLNKFDRQNSTFSVYRVENSRIPSNVICGILEDKKGLLWLSTTNGLSQFDPKTGMFKIYDTKDGLLSDDFNTRAFWQVDNGKMYFGGAGGLNTFFPEKIKDNPFKPRMAITGIQIFNRFVGIDEYVEGRKILTQNITSTREINLNYLHSSFSIQYAALHFAAPVKNHYQYFMEGIDKEWYDAGTRRFAHYAHLPPKTYTFKVKGSNHDDVWSQEIASLKIVIDPPPWATWWAYSLYFLLFAAIVAGFVRSQRKKLKYERSVNERLRQVDRLKDEFLANTSHELRTPLNGIIGIAESLMKGATGPLPPQTVENLRMVTSSGKRLSHLVNDILDYSKLKEKDLDLQLKSVDLRSLTDVVLLLSKPLTAGKQIDLKNKIGKDIPLVCGDENRLEQVMHNLIENAIKFTDSGEVTISAELTGEESPMVKLTVKDTGIGIPREKHKDIFKSFEQVDMSSTRQYGGTGLGLSISAKLVELHNGTIGVDSELSKGTSFWFTIPVMQNRPSSIPSGVDFISKGSEYNSFSSSPPFTKFTVDNNNSAINNFEENNNDYMAIDIPCRILAVDDEIVNLQVLANHLSLHRYTVIKAMNGMDALKIISEPATKPDIVLLDVMMPRMSGYEVCIKVREMFSASELPIIMLTAKNQMANLLEGLDSGANDYITKPFSSEELLERIKVHLQLLKANRDLKGANEKLADYNRTLEQKVAERTMELREKNRLIMDSINFAQRVQEDILPLEEKIKSAIPDHFIVFKPRDVVSGDFYWFEQIAGINYLAVVDCTGHGVPGALMSMIGYTILNKLVIEQRLNDPAIILEYLHKDVRAALKQRRGRHVDTAGMDICLCKIEDNVITYSGAHIPLYIVKYNTGETSQIKGDRKTIGGMQMDVDLTFSKTQILLEPGDMVYLASDGFPDQHNSKGRKFGKKNFRKLLSSIAPFDLEIQKQKSVQALEKHMDSEDQRDDITLVGIRLC